MDKPCWQALRSTLQVLSLFVFSAYAQTVLPPPGQPLKQGNVGGFELIGKSLVSAQQLFVGTPDKVFFVDKVENNPQKIKGHPAWASEWALGANTQRPMDAITNTFCAGGSVLGNGTWLNVGGNQAVTYGGLQAPSQFGGGPYNNPDGRQSETLPDGTIIILGGCRFGGYVNSAFQDNPTYEFFPPKGGPITSPILQSTLPANLYPLTWLLPSGQLLIQSNWKTVKFDYKNNVETPLDDIPDAVRVYPASAGTIMLPLTPANNYTATLLFCGGSNVQPKQWTSSSFNPPIYPASSSCVRLTPDLSSSYVKEVNLPEPRSMANFIALPNGKILNINGARLGTAGYGNDSWAIGHSYADNPVLKPAIYDPEAEDGERWSSDGLQASGIPRMYHSSATLLPDGSVMISGSNPNPDVILDDGFKYPTEYRTEIFYPSYFNERRPQPKGLLSQYSYGGASFDVTLDSDDLFDNLDNVQNAKVIIIRTGFSTHAMNMGQRFLQLNSTYTAFKQNSTAILHVSQLPPNAAIIAPGPAFIFVVVNGIPSIGQMVMLGSGKLGRQALLDVAELPASSMVSAPSGTVDHDTSAALSWRYGGPGTLCAGIVTILASILMVSS
ncbi:hypothetical protein CVT24_000185 [Panaeolus cyanescens]|uniref:Galactose oxidase-like Early set domain-containing protein n=1 Tax=Panaeolus cyanescens TaxID=181874 RepID=A0A409W378_9AGAR|nr:hypothetical protein CVT24_000185 [Panaeolus cyanescens]